MGTETKVDPVNEMYKKHPDVESLMEFLSNYFVTEEEFTTFVVELVDYKIMTWKGVDKVISSLQSLRDLSSTE